MDLGSGDYSREELVAEMGAAFLCGEAGIFERTLNNSAAYLQGWLKALDNDRSLIITAAAQAQKAAVRPAAVHALRRAGGAAYRQGEVWPDGRPAPAGHGCGRLPTPWPGSAPSRRRRDRPDRPRSGHRLRGLAPPLGRASGRHRRWRLLPPESRLTRLAAPLWLWGASTASPQRT